MALDVLIDALRPFREFILPGVFVAFLLGTAFALALTHWRAGSRVGAAERRPLRWLLPADGRPVRRLWLTAFFSGIVVTSLVGAPIVPFVDMNKFSERADDEFTYYEIRMVDGEGNEIRYDLRAVPPVSGASRHTRLAGMMVHDFSEAERLEMAGFLFESAVEYRAEVESGHTPWHERLDAPYYSQEPPWQPAELEAMSAFESIKVYERTIVYGEEDTEIVDRSERELLWIDPETGTVEERGEP